MVATQLPLPSPQPANLPVDNPIVAERLDETAELLAAREVNPYRVRAYHVAAQTVRGLDRPVHEVVSRNGLNGLIELPGIGDSIGRTIERLVATGTFPLLERLRGRNESNAMFATVPGLGPKTAARIRAELGIERCTTWSWRRTTDAWLVCRGSVANGFAPSANRSQDGFISRSPKRLVRNRRGIPMWPSCWRLTKNIAARRRKVGSCKSRPTASTPKGPPGCRFSARTAAAAVTRRSFPTLRGRMNWT
jgi:hypothetical protein